MQYLRILLFSLFFALKLRNLHGFVPLLESTGDHTTWENLVFKDLVKNHLQDCLLIVTGSVNSNNPSMEENIRFLSEEMTPYLLLDPEEREMISNGTHETVFKTVAYSFPPPQCMAVVSDVSATSLLQNTLSFLEEMNFHEWPYIKVILFGLYENVKEVFTTYILRNSIPLIHISPKQNEKDEENFPSSLVIHGRCFYCSNGVQNQLVAELKQKNHYKISRNVFKDMPKDYQGHQFKIVALSWYPITGLEPLSSEPCTATTPTDSVDIRMITEISRILNFRYIAYFPCDNQWGTDDGNGNWSGTVGTLQHNMADFSFLLSLYHSRTRFIDYSTPYILEPVTFVARKPQPLPRSLALLRPFAGTVWLVVTTAVIMASGVFWIIHKLSRKERALDKPKTLLDSFFYMLNIFLQLPTTSTPHFYAIRIFIGWWWLYCMVVTLSYRSSLMAHLTFPSKAQAVHYASELVQGNGKWTWGYEPIYDSGWTWFKDSENEYYQTIFKNFELLWKDDQMKKVMEGNHAYFTYYFYIKSIIQSEYMDDFGYTPIYIAKEKYLNYGGYGWAFRKGAPFRFQIDKLMRHIIEAGLIKTWVNELIEVKARKVRKERILKEKKEEKSSILQYQRITEGLIVLGLDHMQGAFYLYFVGCGTAFACLLVELGKRYIPLSNKA